MTRVTFRKIIFGDRFHVSDEGDGVIRVDVVLPETRAPGAPTSVAAVSGPQPAAAATAHPPAGRA